MYRRQERDRSVQKEREGDGRETKPDKPRRRRKGGLSAELSGASILGRSAKNGECKVYTSWQSIASMIGRRERGEGETSETLAVDSFHILAATRSGEAVAGAVAVVTDSPTFDCDEVGDDGDEEEEEASGSRSRTRRSSWAR